MSIAGILVISFIGGAFVTSLVYSFLHRRLDRIGERIRTQSRALRAIEALIASRKRGRT